MFLLLFQKSVTHLRYEFDAHQTDLLLAVIIAQLVNGIINGITF